MNQIVNPYTFVEERQRADPEIRILKVRWHNLANMGPQNAHDEDFFATYIVDENRDLLYKVDTDGRYRLVVPNDLTQDILYQFHDHPEAGYPGRDETLRAIKANYYWSAMDNEVKEYVQSCLICATIKTTRQKETPQRPHTPRRPWQMISIDILGPYEKSRFGNTHANIAVDLFSKWVEVQPVSCATTNRVVTFLEREIFARWGTPEVIITDNGGQFLGNRYENLLELYHIQCVYSPIYQQRANPVERRVQEFKKILRTQLINKSDREWEQS